MRRRHLSAVSALAFAIVGAASPTSAQLTVFDPNNYAQNVLTAARELQQINNQITSLHNQAQMLINQAKISPACRIPRCSSSSSRSSEPNSFSPRPSALPTISSRSIEHFRRPMRRPRPANRSSVDRECADALAEFCGELAGCFARSSDRRSAISTPTVQRCRPSLAQARARPAHCKPARPESASWSAGAATRRPHGCVVAQGRAQNLETAQRTAAQDQGREQLRRFLAPGRGYQPSIVRMFHQ